MTLNKQKGNMYGFISHTWNAIKGKCPYDCSYCYMKVFPQGELRLDEKELKTDLGKGNFIFVGSSCDMFADTISTEWIMKVIGYCNLFPENTYLFQTKNPKRFEEFEKLYPPKCIFGTTIETNRKHKIGNAPSVEERALWMSASFLSDKRKMITIEPIMVYDVDILINWIKRIRPEFVNIGADSKNHNLPEPSKEDIDFFIEELKKFTKVNSKNNLSRIK